MMGKVIRIFALTLVFYHAEVSQAAQVVAHRADNLSGQMIGGWGAVLLGGLAGGPVGAIAGGLAGAWLGGEVQQAMGASGDAYLVETDDGEVRRMRSPNHQFEVGDEVSIQGIRPVPVTHETSIVSDQKHAQTSIN